MNPRPAFVENQAEPVPHSLLLPPLHAFIGCVSEFVYSGELEAIASGSIPCDAMHHGRELRTALQNLRTVASPINPQYRSTTWLERGIAFDLNNLLCPLQIRWSCACQTTDPREAAEQWCEITHGLARALRLARWFVAMLESGDLDAELA